MRVCEPRSGRRPASSRLLQEGLAIEAEDAASAGVLAFLARILVQATLPHSRPRSHEYERVNGRFTLHMYAPPSVGLPYGSYPRLILTWLNTEAVKKGSPTLELGPSLSAFMHRLGVTPITGKRGTTSRLRGQLHRLFSTSIRWSYENETEGHASGTGYMLVHQHDVWWSPRDPDEPVLWNSTVTLGAEFYEEIVRHAVPLDLRALRALKGSPMTLDIYTWLTYRLSYLPRPARIPWAALAAQFGAGYRRRRDFKRKFLAHLQQVLYVYPAARVTATATGLLLKPSPSHVPKRLARD